MCRLTANTKDRRYRSTQGAGYSDGLVIHTRPRPSTQPRPQPEPISHPVITNNSPALVAQALSGRDPCQKQYFNIGMGYQDNLVTITKK